jgi:L-alanine-DL-glutamate epimerase-like enolase superfamily enzyme
MELNFKPYSLEYKYPFGVSGNRRTHTPVVFTSLSADGFSGYGEACLPPYLGETQENTLAFLEKCRTLLKKFSTKNSIEEILRSVDHLSESNNAAKAAVDIALHDLMGKIQNKACYELFGFKRPSPKHTACTIGIDEDETLLAKKINEAKDFTVLKIKAGTDDDKKLISTIRKYTDKPLFIDVNQGWKDKHFVVDMLRWLKAKGVFLVEQPMPINRLEEMAWVKQHNILPLIADENVKRLEDIEKIKDCFNGINIKLMKCTGLFEANKMIELAKKNNLKIFLGCMAESSCATSAMAQFLEQGDYIDLDAPNLLKYDPFEGVEYKNGQISLANGLGIGAKPQIEL